jgi:hypothetical protein
MKVIKIKYPDLRIQSDWEYSFEKPSSFWISYQGYKGLKKN